MAARRAANWIYIYIYIYIYETCAWTPNNVFGAVNVVESLSCKFEVGLGTAHTFLHGSMYKSMLMLVVFLCLLPGFCTTLRQDR